MVDFLPIIFTPSSPVEFEGNIYSRLTFSRPVAFVDVLVAEAYSDPVQKMNAVAASLAGVHASVVDALSVEDQLRLAVAVEPILALPPITPGA